MTSTGKEYTGEAIQQQAHQSVTDKQETTSVLKKEASPTEDTTRTSFILPNSTPGCTVTLPHNLTQEQLLSFKAFKEWHIALTHALSLQIQKSHTFNKNPYKLRSIDVQAADWFTKTKLGFVKLQAEIKTDPTEDGKYDWLPGAVFLRGGSVAMLIIVQPDDVTPGTETDKHVVLTVQPRIAAASLALAELPAGMLDNGTFAGQAATEIQEEVKMKVPEDKLFNMSKLAVSEASTQLWKQQNTTEASTGEEIVQSAMYPSPGACDEFIPLFLYQKRMKRSLIDEMSGRLTGLRKEGERITLKLVRLEDLWKEGARDAKALAALALYEGLRKEGKLPDPDSE